MNIQIGMPTHPSAAEALRFGRAEVDRESLTYLGRGRLGSDTCALDCCTSPTVDHQTRAISDISGISVCVQGAGVREKKRG
jgi:hypothetical protein